MTNDKWKMTKAPGNRGLISWQGKTGRFNGMRATKRGLLRKWNSSHPVVDTVPTIIIASIIVIAVITTAQVVISAVTTVVSETIGITDESQLALDLRPV